MHRIHHHIVGTPRIIRFGFVGATCAVVQLVCLFGFIRLGVEKQVANITAIIIATEANILLSRQITWLDRRVPGIPIHEDWHAVIAHHVLLGCTLVINEAVFALAGNRLPYLLAAVCGIAAAAVANYSGSNYMIFRSHSAVLPHVQSSLPSIADNPRRVLVSVRDDRAHSNTR